MATCCTEVSAHYVAVMATIFLNRSKRDICRERWRRNKRAERQRLREKRKRDEAQRPSPPNLDADFLDQVWAERDKRLRNFPWRMPHLPDRKFFKNTSNFSSQALVCDVWAAEVILAASSIGDRISDGDIAKYLIKHGRDHGVKPSSLRTKVWRTRPIVRFLEEAPVWDRPGKYWPKFPESMQELGSGLQQHVDKVMAYLEATGAFEEQA